MLLVMVTQVTEKVEYDDRMKATITGTIKTPLIVNLNHILSIAPSNIIDGANTVLFPIGETSFIYVEEVIEKFSNFAVTL